MTKTKVGIDSNVFIYVLEQHPGFYQASLELLKRVEAGQLAGVSSELTSLEVLSDKKLHDAQVATVLDFLASSMIAFQAVTHDVLLAAAHLRRQNSSLKTPDAIHLASAILSGATYFVTNDQKLYKKSISGIRLVPLSQAEALLAV